ncbi:hypothetical protein LguiB_024075 [Lonicera macranthoides]
MECGIAAHDRKKKKVMMMMMMMGERDGFLRQSPFFFSLKRHVEKDKSGRRFE